MTNDENPWESYTETVLYFSPEPQVFIDLRKPVSAGVRDALAEIGLSGEFSILTAYNPHGRNLSGEENTRRLSELEAELVESGEFFVRVDACSPEGSRSRSCPSSLRSWPHTWRMPSPAERRSSPEAAAWNRCRVIFMNPPFW